MITIKGFKYIQHKLKQRQWGCECQFTVVSETDGRTFNEVIAIPSLKIEEKELVIYVEERLKLVSAPRPAEPVPEKVYTQSEIDAALKEKKYFSNGQHYPDDLATKTIGVK